MVIDWLIVCLLFFNLFFLIHLIFAVREPRIWIEMEIVDRFSQARKT